jgi:AcrR family transcriptional regulator
MSKKRYTLYISRPLARRFEEIARQRNGAKSALVEEALAESLKPKLLPGVEDALARRLDELTRTQNIMERDVAIVTETLSLFVRYFLTVMPPLPADELEPARLLGKERFEAFVAEVGRQLAGDQRLVSEVLESIVANNPDLFGSAGIDAPRRSPPTPAMAATVTTLKAFAPKSSEGNGHG